MRRDLLLFFDTSRDGQQLIAFDGDSPHLASSVLDGYDLVSAKAAHPSLCEGKGRGTGSADDRLLRRTKVFELSVGFADPVCDIDVA